MSSARPSSGTLRVRAALTGERLAAAIDDRLVAAPGEEAGDRLARDAAPWRDLEAFLDSRARRLAARLSALRRSRASTLSTRTGRALHQGTAIEDARALLPCGHDDFVAQFDALVGAERRMTAMRPPQCERRMPTPALGAALLLAVACAVGPDYERPALPVTQTYRDWPTQLESIADLAWWQVFRDEALERLIREALGNNRDLAAATERVEQARYLAGVQRGELFPDLGYEGDAARGRDTQFGAPVQNRGVESDYLGAATAFWELDVWGRLRRASEAARAEMLATEAFRRGVVLSLVAGVAQAYFELLELDLELEIARRNVQSFTETRDLFQRQFQGGIASRLDPLRGEAALAQVASTVPELERRIVEKENELSVLIGAPPGPIPRGLALTAQTMPPEVPAGVPAQLLERRPDLIEAEERLVATNALVGVAFSDFFPRIELTAFGGTVSNELEDAMSADASGIWSILGSAIGPVFTFGRVWYGWRAAERDASAARANYERAVLNALREVSNALVAREKLALVRLERERAVEALSEALRTARTRYMGGRATYLEVLDAQQQLFPAENDLARTRRDELLALVALNRALAGGWKQEPEAPAVPGPLAP